MMGKHPGSGSPRGPGHYSRDGKWWWEEDQRRWFGTTDEHDVLEIEAEDVGSTSWSASLLETLAGERGTAYYRFVGRARSADTRWPTYRVVGATFPVTRPSLDDRQVQGAWLTTIRNRLDEMHRDLVACGWRPVGHGAHWWSAIYERPGIDWNTPRTCLRHRAVARATGSAGVSCTSVV